MEPCTTYAAYEDLSSHFCLHVILIGNGPYGLEREWLFKGLRHDMSSVSPTPCAVTAGYGHP